MINEAKSKHGITHREFKKTDSDLNLATKMQIENKNSYPCIHLGKNKLVFSIYY